MFIGHFAPAFVAAAASPRSPGLGTLFVAGQLVDWGFFTLAMVGVEAMRIEPGATAMVPYDLYHMPYTHSLLGTAIWALAFALVIWIAKRNAVGGMLAGVVVLTHWLLDWLTHRPDLTLAGGSDTFGLGLWNYPAIAMPLEIGITVAAFVFYMRRTRGPIGQPLILLGVMLALQAVNWFAPHPTEAGTFVYAQALIAFGLLTALAVWVGQNRYYIRHRGLASSSL
jgi:hypothetical protein